MTRRLIHALAAAAMVAAATSAQAGNPEADEAAIRKRLVDWTAAFNARDAVGACDLFASDLVYTIPEIIDGTQAAMCENLAKLFAKPVPKLSYAEPMIHEIILVGDVAVVRLTWTLTVEVGDKTDTTTEEGIDIFRRQADGRWSIARFIAFTTRPNTLMP
jgi:steroid delta-isomerase